MSHYIMIRRLRGPAILLLIGGVWLLHATGVINHPWSWFWPLLLILIGVFMLAERAALAAEDGYPVWPYPGQPYPGANPGPIPGVMPPSSPAENSATVSASSQEYEKNSQGGQS
ncbi:MAG: DUF5668 domain-containing protein [Terracidiphilus sp.]|jgi:hypothetical protein